MTQYIDIDIDIDINIDININLFEKLLVNVYIQNGFDCMYFNNTRNLYNFYINYMYDNNWNETITINHKFKLFIPFLKYINSKGVYIYRPNSFYDIICFFFSILDYCSIINFNKFCKLFMSNYCITLYTPKYFYDNLEQYILSKNIIFNYNKLLIIIKCFIDYKYIPINLIMSNIHKYITYLKLIKTDNEKKLLIKKCNTVGFNSIEKKEQIYYNYITDIEAITNELYFACSYRYVWIGAVIRGILFKYSCFD